MTVGLCVLAEHVDRTGHYRLLADRLRELADNAQFPEIRAELLWLAQSYERLAAAPELTRIAEGCRSLEILDAAAEASARDDERRLDLGFLAAPLHEPRD
jgi:hypothetical protein